MATYKHDEGYCIIEEGDNFQIDAHAEWLTKPMLKKLMDEYAIRILSTRTGVAVADKRFKLIKKKSVEILDK